MSQNEYGAYGATIGICAGMIAALCFTAVIAIVQGQDARDEQRLREQVAEKSGNNKSN